MLPHPWRRGVDARVDADHVHIRLADQHSGYPDKAGRDRFAIEGSKVEPQDLEAYDRYLHKVYVELRLS